MARKKFHFNRDTLQFEQREKPLRHRLARRCLQVVICLGIGVCLMLGYSLVFDTPHSHALLRANKDLKMQIGMLEAQVESSSEQISLIEKRDNHLYRTIFESDSIPASIRQGGVGGAERYDEFDNVESGERLRSLALRLDNLSWRTYIQSKSFDEVTKLANAKERLLRSIPAIQPISIKELRRISSLFGVRVDPFTKQGKMHSGLDFVGAPNTPIHATGDGVVFTTKHSATGYGNQIIIDHGFGYKTRYAHLNKIFVQEGQKIKRGQVIGAMGSTGRSTATHLHYEVLVKNVAVNPMLYFTDMTEETYEEVLLHSDQPALD